MLRTIAITFAPVLGAVLLLPAALAASDSMLATQVLAQESAGKGVMVCVGGNVTRRPAKRRDSTWEQVFGVQEFRCGEWRLRDELERMRPTYAAGDAAAPVGL